MINPAGGDGSEESGSESESEDEMAQAIRDIFSCTHHVAEGAGASAVAALMKERDRLAGKRVAAIVSGGNIDTQRYLQVLAGKTPVVD